MNTSAAESSPPPKPTGPVPPEDVTDLPHINVQSLEKMQEDLRREIAKPLVFAYLGLLALSILVPVALLWLPHVSVGEFTNARDLMLAMSGALSGLVGILGFVMGYYFKALERSTYTTAPPNTSDKQ
jgi:hypothetical protein